MASGIGQCKQGSLADLVSNCSMPLDFLSKPSSENGVTAPAQKKAVAANKKESAKGSTTKLAMITVPAEQAVTFFRLAEELATRAQQLGSNGTMLEAIRQLSQTSGNLFQLRQLVSGMYNGFHASLEQNPVRDLDAMRAVGRWFEEANSLFHQLYKVAPTAPAAVRAATSSAVRSLMVRALPVAGTVAEAAVPVVLVGGQLWLIKSAMEGKATGSDTSADRPLEERLGNPKQWGAGRQ